MIPEDRIDSRLAVVDGFKRGKSKMNTVLTVVLLACITNSKMHNHIYLSTLNHPK